MRKKGFPVRSKARHCWILTDLLELKGLYYFCCSDCGRELCSQYHHALVWGELHPQYDQINIKIEILGCIPSALAIRFQDWGSTLTLFWDLCHHWPLTATPSYLLTFKGTLFSANKENSTQHHPKIWREHGKYWVDLIMKKDTEYKITN